MSPPCDPPKAPATRQVAQRVDPRVALICILSFVTLQAATPIQEWQRFIAYTCLLLAAVLRCRISALWLSKRLLLAIPFILGLAVSVLLVRPAEGNAIHLFSSFAVSLPLLILLASVTVKASLSIIALSLLVALWETPVLLRALQALRVPKLFLMLTAFMWRYIQVLTTEGQRMLQAREARGTRGRLVRRATIVGAMTGSLFLRGYERAERVGHAMVARGYDGTTHLLTPEKCFTLADAGLVLGLWVMLGATWLI